MDSVLNGVNVCGGLLPGEYRYRTLCLYANGDVVLCPFVSFRSPFGTGLDEGKQIHTNSRQSRRDCKCQKSMTVRDGTPVHTPGAFQYRQ